MLPIALDAMGGDKAPGEIVAGARLATDEQGIPVVLVGRAADLGDTHGLPVIDASEVIAMDEDPGGAVRRKKDSSLVRAVHAAIRLLPGGSRVLRSGHLRRTAWM